MKRVLSVFLGLTFFFCCVFLPNSFSSDARGSVSNGAANLLLKDIKGVVYITGIGCGNCAIVDPYILAGYLPENEDTVVVEYEIYKDVDKNLASAQDYFNNYLDGDLRVPALIFSKERTAIGRMECLDAIGLGNDDSFVGYPLPTGETVTIDKLDFSTLNGKVKVFFRDKVLYFDTTKVASALVKKILFAEDMDEVLLSVKHTIDEDKQLPISEGKVVFQYAAKIGNLSVKWGDREIHTAHLKSSAVVNEERTRSIFRSKVWLGIALFLLVLTLLFSSIGQRILKISDRTADWCVVFLAVLFIIAFISFAVSMPGTFLKEMGYNLPLPIFTFLVAIVDGVNPCNLFVLTFLLAMLVSVSDKRDKVYLIGFLFILVVFCIYFFFMMAWLAAFKIFSFIAVLRRIIAVLAILAGLINCKELLFFRKGITLMVQEKHKGPLLRRVGAMKHIIQNGSWSVIVVSSITLAAFASFVELPCTAGFPLIYVKILSDKFLASSMGYLWYMLFYNIIYVMPLIFVVTLFGWTFRAKQITQRQMQIIKFIGGVIMILLGIILLANPALLGINF